VVQSFSTFSGKSIYARSSNLLNPKTLEKNKFRIEISLEKFCEVIRSSSSKSETEYIQVTCTNYVVCVCDIRRRPKVSPKHWVEFMGSSNT
jgi:hypothetical protein